MQRHHYKFKMRKKIKQLILVCFLLVVVISAYFAIPKYLGASIYPLSYQNEIIASSKEFSVDPNFIAAVILTESRFRPDAHSGVGAIGLMQIMPATGAGIAKQLGDKDFTTSKLYEPARNIRYGTYYLKQQLDKYGGNESLVLMHYNGGPRAVNSYRTRGVLPRETQGFVRKVTGSKNMYETIYGEWWKPKEKFIPLDDPSQKPTLNVREFWRALIAPKGGW
ncbi:MAG: lytic transglycosylase domain-containing protein [bacterium]|nr:lytic transglycosylase domain-containing protein [bacterium]